MLRIGGQKKQSRIRNTAGRYSTMSINLRGNLRDKLKDHTFEHGAIPRNQGYIQITKLKAYRI